MNNELGYNYLNTSFSGTKSSALSGNELFPMLFEDMGVAAPLSHKEFKNPGCIPPIS